MIELVFIACLSASPGDCEERRLLYTDVTPMTCLMKAQPELARWVNEHPQWKVSGWKCQMMRTADIEA